MRRSRPVVLVAALACLLVGLGTTAAGAQQQPYPPPPPPDPPPARVEVSCDVDASREIACEGEGYLADSEVAVDIRATGRGSNGRRLAAFMDDVDGEGRFSFTHQLRCEDDGRSVRIRVSGRDASDRPATVTVRLDVPPPPDDCQQVAAGDDASNVAGVSDQRQDGAGGPDGAGGRGDERSSTARQDGAGSNGRGSDRGDGDAASRNGRGGAAPGEAESSGGGIDVFRAVERAPDGGVATSGRNLLLLVALALVLATALTVGMAWRRHRVGGAPAA